ncbi:biotin transport system permease protein [Microlunatus soli]|uniref:Biotin transport system permease protein n=2 Tax=Microlunatus soli TaxID=630515 RepID=A0A1H1Z2U2_9ACTN|nr:biotin transport system permease protein [Microlunatus soli]
MNVATMNANSLLAPVPTAVKFGVLFVAGIGLYLITAPIVLGALLTLAVIALLLTRAPARRLARTVAGVLIIIGVVVLLTGLGTGWQPALVTGLRLLTLCLLAYAVSLSTTFSAMLDFFDRLLAPTARFGLDPGRISLALALTVRFIPQIRDTYQQVREAQQARGLQSRPLATVVPLLVRTLQSAEQIADAIDARCYDSRGR